MSSSRLYRLSGLVLLVGAGVSVILTIINTFAFPNDNNYNPAVVTSAPWQIVNLLLLIAGVLVLLTVPAVYLRQAKQTGILGLIGFASLAIAGMMFAVALQLVDTLIIPWLASVAPKLAEGNGPPTLFIFYIVVSLFLVVGTVLFGIASLRARVFPRAASALLIAAGIINLLNFAPLPSTLGNIIGALGTVLINVALAWFGYTIMAPRKEAAMETQTSNADMQVSA